jgi:hypothetical protein
MSVAKRPMTKKPGQSSPSQRTYVKKKIAKTSEPNTSNTTPTKNGWFDYLNIFSQEMCPMNHEGIQRLATEIIEWAQNDDEALKVSQFFLKKGIGQTTWVTWCSTFPSLQEAHNNARTIIGNRREIGALKKKYDSGIVATSMAHYDKEWREAAEWRASLREKHRQESTSGPQIVIMEKIPTCDLVPERKNDRSDTDTSE